MPRRFGGGNMINRRGGSRTARFTNEMSHRFDGPPRTSVPTVVISNCILVRATNETPWRFNTSSTASRSKHAKDACFSHRRRLSLRREQAPALRWQHQIASKSVQQKRRIYNPSVQKAPEIPRVARPFGVRLRPARVILSAGSERAKSNRYAAPSEAKVESRAGLRSRMTHACVHLTIIPFSKVFAGS